MTIYFFLQLAGPYLALAAALSTGVFFFRKAKADERRSAEQVEATIANLKQRLESAEEAVTRLRSDLQTTEEQFRVSAGFPAKSWSNISRRTQALRLLKAGQKPFKIAAELGMTVGEVELIAKVTRIVANDFQSIDSGSDSADSTFSVNA